MYVAGTGPARAHWQPPLPPRDFLPPATTIYTRHDGPHSPSPTRAPPQLELSSPVHHCCYSSSLYGVSGSGTDRLLCLCFACLSSPLFLGNGGPRQACGAGADHADEDARAVGELLGRPGRGPVRPRRRGGRGARVRAVRVLQRREPRRAGGRGGPAGGRGRPVLRVLAGREGRVGPSGPVRVREQAHRAQWRHGVARVPPPRHRPRHALQGLPGADVRAEGRDQRVRGRHARAGEDGTGDGGGGAGRVAAGRAGGHGDRRRERPGVPGEPLPALPAAAGAPAQLQRDRVRRAHGPAAGVHPALQRHGRAPGRAPRRAVGVRPAQPRRLLRQRRRLPPGSDEREAEECAAPGGGRQRTQVPRVDDLLRRATGGAEDCTAAAAAGGDAELAPLQGLHMGRIQEGGLPLSPRRQPAGPLRDATCRHGTCRPPPVLASNVHRLDIYLGSFRTCRRTYTTGAY